MSKIKWQLKVETGKVINNVSMKNACYLCGSPLSSQESGDHIVPKQLIKRKQPRVKGFDYAGMLPSHADCNNRFPPEKYCQKALKLISVLQDNNCFTIRTHQDNPDIKILTINSNCLSAFSQQDLKFFKISDVTNKDISKWSNPLFYKNKSKSDPLKQALFYFPFSSGKECCRFNGFSKTEFSAYKMANYFNPLLWEK